MSDTSVPGIQWTPTGLVLPQESAILAGVQEDQNAAFGGGLNPALNTPQGQLATSTTAIIADKNSTIAELVDQVDPDFATGFMQDAIARIYFLNRNPGLPTVVICQCVGALGTIIPVGAQVQDTNGNIYSCTEEGTIPVGGTISLPFANVVLGPIACPANTVTTIYIQIPGWDTVNNSAPGTTGADVESPADFEFRRQNSVAANAHGSLPSIYGAVFKVNGVIDCFVVENVTDSPISGAIAGNPNSTNYTVLAHSVYVAVTGGLAQDVANAIWTKKNEGSNMNGNTDVTVVDDSGYSFPKPEYPITFEIPDPTPYSFIVNIKNSAALPSTIVADVTAAITAQFNGTNGGQRARIGSLLLAASYYGPVANCEGPSVPVSVLSIFIGSTFTGTAKTTLSSEVLNVITRSAGTITAGSIVAGTDIPTGTTIVKQLTGSAGDVGTYQMSAAATATHASAEAIVGTGSTSQQIGIDQQPVIGNVVVNLV